MQVERDGGVTASDLPPVPGPKRKAGDWHRSVPRWALEYHFGRGALTVANRLPNFQRVYDLPKRVIPAEYRSIKLADADARRELLRLAGSALGVATLHDLADYYRMTPAESAPHVDELVAAGEIGRGGQQGSRDRTRMPSSAFKKKKKENKKQQIRNNEAEMK